MSDNNVTRVSVKENNIAKNKKNMKIFGQVVLGIVVFIFIISLFSGGGDSDNSNAVGANTEEVIEDDEEGEKEENTFDTTASEIISNSLQDECSYETTGEALFTVHGLYGSHLGNFVSLGSRIFEDETCNHFYYTLYVDSMDSKGNDSKITAMMLHMTREQSSEYNWKNLEGHTVYNQFKNDDIIIMMNTNGVDTDKIRLGTVQ